MTDEATKKELVERPNKEQQKRQTQALKELIVQLIALPVSKLDGLSLEDGIRTAVRAARAMERTALNRQIKYITGLMRNYDVELISRELYLLAQPHKQEVQAFHETEQWRDALLGGDDAVIDTVVERFVAADRQHLRQLVRNARKEQEQGRTPKAARILFRYLTELQGNS